MRRLPQASILSQPGPGPWTNWRISSMALLVGGWPTPLKNMNSSMGRMTSHIWNEKSSKCSKHFQTTNQAFYIFLFDFWILSDSSRSFSRLRWSHGSPASFEMFRAIRRHRGLDRRLRGYLKKSMKKIHGPSENCENLGKSSSLESGRRKILDIHLIKSCSTWVKTLATWLKTAAE